MQCRSQVRCAPRSLFLSPNHIRNGNYCSTAWITIFFAHDFYSIGLKNCEKPKRPSLTWILTYSTRVPEAISMRRPWVLFPILWAHLSCLYTFHVLTSLRLSPFNETDLIISMTVWCGGNEVVPTLKAQMNVICQLQTFMSIRPLFF